MEAYINGIGIISPQKTFTGNGFSEEIVSKEGCISLKCLEPVYSDYLDPMASRRMSRVIKMGLVSAMKCLKEAEIEMPDAVITGTGFGCIEDTEKFLGSIFTNGEKMLNPTPFIQSTHNTIAASIALKLKCNNYNNTFAHRGFSFEHAILDGLLLLNERSGNNILVGGIDETTPNYLIILQRLGLLKRKGINNLQLFEKEGKGTIAGEGAAFFMVSHMKNEKSYARIQNLHTFFKPADLSETEDQINRFLKDSGTAINEIDLVISGMNGSPGDDEIYHQLFSGIFKTVPVANYKHLCGEYDTSSSFALWLASIILKTGMVPDVVKYREFPVKKTDKILIYNHLRNINHSLILLSKC